MLLGSGVERFGEELAWGDVVRDYKEPNRHQNEANRRELQPYRRACRAAELLTKRQ
jgi:hypothetical protein